MTGAEMGVVRLRTGEPATPETSGGGGPEPPWEHGSEDTQPQAPGVQSNDNVFCGFKTPGAWSFHSAAPRDGSIWGPSPA